MIGGLQDADKAERVKSLHELATIASESFVDVMTGCLKDENVKVRVKTSSWPFATKGREWFGRRPWRKQKRKTNTDKGDKQASQSKAQRHI